MYITSVILIPSIAVFQNSDSEFDCSIIVMKMGAINNVLAGPVNLRSIWTTSNIATHS